MKCQNVSELLLVYLDNETSPSERALIQSHLAGCESCRQKLATLSSTRNLLSQSLKVRAAQAAPSPQALSRLQARLADEALPPHLRLIAWFKRSAPDAGYAQSNSHLKGISTMKLRFAFATLALAVALVATVALVPSVGAQVGEQVAKLFFTIVSGPIDTSIDKLPGYLPEFGSPPIAGSGAAQSTDPSAPRIGKFEEIYQKGDKFLVFTKSGISNGDTLPKGKATTVNGKTGVSNTGLSGQYRQDLPDTTGGVDQNGQPVNLKPITINYANANKLTWIDGNTQFEMLSNLAVEEMIQIAGKLLPAK